MVGKRRGRSYIPKNVGVTMGGGRCGGGEGECGVEGLGRGGISEAG